MTKAELLELSETIYDRLVAGDSPKDIKDLYGLDDETYARARKLALETRAHDVRDKSRELVFVEYCIAQERNIEDINRFLRELDSARQYNAVVGAIRLRADLVDRMIQRGMDFGVIRREPERREVVAGLVVTEMSSDDLKKAIMGQINKMNDMISRFGDDDIGKLSTGALHYGDVIETPAEEVVHALAPKIEGASQKTVKRKVNHGRKRILPEAPV
jgi:hypothetical protein